MKNVSSQLKAILLTTFIAIFAISAVFVNPQSAMALTVSYKLSTPVSADYQTYYYEIDGSGFEADEETPLSQTFSYKLSTPVSDEYQTYFYNIEDIIVEASDAAEASGISTPTSSAANSVTQQTVTIETLAEGTKYATDLYIIESGKPGPVVMIVGGVHGNEPAGYTAAAEVSDWKIENGTLLVLPEANKRAVDRNVRYVSGEGDLNRDFPQSSSESADNTLSKAIWAALKKYDVEWLMDMHEGYDYYKNTSTDSVGQSIIYYPSSGTYSVVSEIADTLNDDISSSYKEFSILKYPVKGSLARAAGQYLGIHSFIFETCDNPALSVRVDYQLTAAKTLLQELDMM